jgi:hypothetical protein
MNKRRRKEERKERKEGETCPFDSPGVHVLCEARKFVGSRINYDAGAISSIGVLQKNGQTPSVSLIWTNTPECCTIDVSMDRVAETVGTFEYGSASKAKKGQLVFVGYEE